MIDHIITLDRIELYLIDVPQKHQFKSGIGIRSSKKTLICKWIDKKGQSGYGECSCRPDPYYSAEFLDASILLIQKFIIPKLSPEISFKHLLDVLKQIRGWNFTKSAIESAALDLISNNNIGSLLSKDLKPSPVKKVPVGISIGIHTDPKEFYDVIQQSIEEGYQRLKFKISPSIDTKVFDAVNSLLLENKVYVNFDANGSYHEDDLKKMAYFVHTYETIIEQPTPPDRFDVLMHAKQLYPDLKICFDEEVKSIGDLIKLHKLNVLDEVNLKVGRVGGLTNSMQIVNYCFEHNISCWIGGMFETGIGRIQNLNVAAFLPNAKAHDLSPSSRYFKEDIIFPEIQMENGFIPVDSLKSCKVNSENLNKFTTNKVVCTIS